MWQLWWAWLFFCKMPLKIHQSEGRETSVLQQAAGALTCRNESCANGDGMFSLTRVSKGFCVVETWNMTLVLKIGTQKCLSGKTGCSCSSTRHLVTIHSLLMTQHIFTFGYVAFEVESRELIHALLGLWSFGGLWITLWLLETTRQNV